MENAALFSRDFDARLSDVRGLTWLPWIGAHYAALPASRRLLIVGESHYTNELDPTKIPAALAQIVSWQNYTRQVVSECCIDQDWPNKTLDTIPRLLFGTAAIRRPAFWADACYYNFIQRPMRFSSNAPERPAFEEFVSGWTVFVKLVAILRPSYCLFIGVQAANSFNYAMEKLGQIIDLCDLTEKISRTSARKAQLYLGEQILPIHFVQHAGKFFSWIRWHDYLRRQFPELLPLIEYPAYRTALS